MSSAYDQLLSLLRRYISQINAQNILARAIREVGIEKHQVSEAHLGELASKLEPSLRLFLRPAALASLQSELGSIGRPSAPLESISLAIKQEADIATARAQARDMCEKLGARRMTIQKLATVVSELARNIYMYSHGGTLEIHHAASPTSSLTVRAVDSGPGITNLDDIMKGNYKSRTGLGAGIRGTKRLCERFDIKTSPAGTTVEAEVAV